MAKVFDEKPLWEKVLNFAKILFRSLNPNAYHDLSQRSFRQGFRFLTRLILVSTFILTVLVIMNLNAFRSNLNQEFSKVDTCRITTNLTDPIVFERQGISIVNTANYTDQNLLITDDEIVRKPLLCTMFRPFCLLQKNPVKTDLTVLGEKTELLGNFIFSILVLMLPSLLFIFFLYEFVRVILIIILVSVLAKVIVNALKHEIQFKPIMVTAMYSSAILVLLQPIDMILFKLHYLHLLLYLLFFALCVALLSERKHRYNFKHESDKF